MKYSDEESDERRNANNAYVKTRWEQLYGLERAASTEGVKYLFLANSGASVAVLAFFGSVPAVRDLSWPKTMLFLFVTGMLLVGVLHFAMYHRTNSLFTNWRDLVGKYYSDSMGWSEVVESDKEKAERFIWIEAIAYLSFFCLIAGAGVGMCNFSTLTSGESNVRKEAPATPKADTPVTTPKANTAVEAGKDH